MEYTDFWLLAEVLVNTLEDALVVRNESCDVVGPDIAQRVPAVISEIVEYDIETVGKQGPERIIQIGRQPVAVTQNEPRAVRVTVSPEYADGAAGYSNLGSSKRFGYFPLMFHIDYLVQQGSQGEK